MFKSNPLTVRFLAFVAFPAVVVAAAGILLLKGSLPVENGTLSSQAVRQPVSIQRDDHGVVYVDAKTDADAFFAVGFAQAQDRMWQLEVQRRIVQGRLSEIFGQETLRQDVWMRTLGLYEAARSAWPRLSPDAQASLTAYAAGVNAWLATNQTLPPEFLALDVKPSPWTPVDSLAWAKVLALSLANNMRSEVAAFVASQYLNREQLAYLLHLTADEVAATTADSRSGKLLSDISQVQLQLESVLRIGGRYAGSNAWAVSGRLMEDGRPVLANDTHLGLQIPSLWYVAHVRGGDLDVSGMTLVGLPIVLFGKNRDIAWGGTSMMADVQDLYFEQPNPHDPDEYRSEGTWEKFEMRTEAIQVRADFPSSLRAPLQPVEIRIRKTRHGPVVSDVVGALDQPVALRWTALDQDDLSYESFYRLNYARNWAEFKEAFRPYVAPALNLLYVDKRGNIGSFGVGRIPVRAKGEGRIPAPGWTGEYRWTGYIPFEDLPQRYNPDSGYLASANDQGVAADYPHFISADWASPSRVQRIDQLIAERTAAGRLISVGYICAMQGDTLDLAAIRLLDWLKQVPLQGQQRRQAQSYLARWGGDMGRDSQGAAIFFVWTKYLREHLFAAKLPGYWNRPQQDTDLRGVVEHTTYEQILGALSDPSVTWCRQGAPDAADSCIGVVSHALDDAIGELRKLRGADMKNWQWGEVNSTLYAHTPFSRIDLVAPLFERRISNGGSPDTINVAATSYKAAVGYEQTFGAGFRQVMHVGDAQTDHLYMNSTGQSGNVLSRHYDDMVRPFRDVKYYNLESSPVASIRSTLVIAPK